MQVKLVSEGDAAQLSRFYEENKEHLRFWEPLRESDYHTQEAWEQRFVVVQ